jgi:hypothetical protein
MILYVNGDSHSLGTMMPGETGASFIEILARHLGCEIYNDAEAASSAQRIVRTSKNYISKQPIDDLFVVIGWGTWEREEWEHDGKFYNIMSGWFKHLPDALQQQYHVWESELNSDHVDSKSRYVHEQIFQLHLLFKQNNIPHLFFNCMYNFFSISPAQEKDWDNCYIGPYHSDSSFYWWLTNRGFGSDKWFHFGADAHRAWADRLIGYIKEQKLL